MATAKKALRDFDDILHMVTGKRLKNIAGTVFNLFGDEAMRRVQSAVNGSPAEELERDSPYLILGVRSDALDVVVRGAYRSLARELHPDTGTHPSAAEFDRVTQAYHTILKERKQARGKGGHSV